MRVGTGVILQPTDVGFELPGGIKVKFDGWEVLLGTAVLVLVLTALVKGMRPWGFWVALGLFIAWVLLTIFRPQENPPPPAGG